MPSYRFEPIEALGLLAALVEDTLDGKFNEGELENDGELSTLYNLADAALGLVRERKLGEAPIMGYDRERDLDRALEELVTYGGGDGSVVEAIWQGLRKDGDNA